MEFEWDEDKRLSNVDKHGIDFLDVRQLFDGRPVIHRHSLYIDEERWLSIAILEDRYTTVIWANRGESIRIISARRARSGEREDYLAIHRRAD